MTLTGETLAPRSGGKPKQLVVLLHGYGSDGADLIGLGQYWSPAFPDALFVSPNAPEPCAGNPFGYQWFALDLDREQGRIDGARRARPLIEDLLTGLWAEHALAPEQTILAGFSQGAMMALHTGLSLNRKLGGIVSFSGLLIEPHVFNQPPGMRPPVALIHGELDNVVDPGFSEVAATALTAEGYDVTLHLSTGIGHSISPDGLEVATALMSRVFAG